MLPKRVRQIVMNLTDRINLAVGKFYNKAFLFSIK